MKKRIQAAVIICLVISSVVFAMLWQGEKRNRDDVRLLAQSAAAQAYASFQSFQATGEESDYWSAVADFRAFEQAYHLLTENTNKSDNYIFCNEVYGSLLLFPEKSQEHISQVIEVMGILSEDLEDALGHSKMSSLRNTLEHG